MPYYNLTLKQSNAIHLAVSGDFIGNKRKQLVTSSGKYLTLWKLTAYTKTFTSEKDVLCKEQVIDEEPVNKHVSNVLKMTKRVEMDKVLEVDVFGYIRAMKKIRHTLENKDYLIISSDSGKIVIIRYENDSFEKVFQEKIGDTGTCRAVLGHFIAVDSQSRAVMIGGLEKAKVVFEIEMSSSKEQPLKFTDNIYDACKEKTVVFDIVPVGSRKNIMFASLEAIYKDDQEISGVPKQFVSFYEVDTSEKSIACIPLDDMTDYGNFLISVPSDSGVLLCASNCVIYLNRMYPAIQCPIPRRVTEITKRPMIFVCATTCKLMGTWIFLAQTEQGDIFQITLGKEDGVVYEIQLKYFTTVHVASAICFFTTGYLFVASEFGNHYLYRILEHEGDVPEFNSSMGLDQSDTFLFIPIALKNLVLVKEFQSLSPIMHLEMVYTEPNGHAHLCVACGRGPNSSFRILEWRTKNPGNKLFKEVTRNLLEHTPRKFTTIQKHSCIILIEADHNAYTMKTKVEKKVQINKAVARGARKYNKLFKDYENLSYAVLKLLWQPLDENIPNIYQCESGTWASTIRILWLQTRLQSQNNSPTKKVEVISTECLSEQLEQNEAAFCLALVQFESQGEDQYILIGVNKLGWNPTVCTPIHDAQSGRIYTYKCVDDELQLVHKTVVEDCPTAMCPFQGCVLIGIGGTLKIYDFSEVMLFVKYERTLCNRIISIHNFDDDNRIYVGDIKDGFLYLLYRPEVNEEESREEKIIQVFAEDIDPSWITTACVWGDDKLVRADKFGNIFIVRLPSENPKSENPISGLEAAVNKILPPKYPAKVEMLATFHVGEMVTCMEVADFIHQKTPEVLVYATLSGSIGILAPIEKGEDSEILTNFEMLMRVTNPSLCGRDHLAYRSYYFPVLDVIDGDLLEQYYSLSSDQRERLNKNVQPSPNEVLQNMRSRFLGDVEIPPGMPDVEIPLVMPDVEIPLVMPDMEIHPEE